MAYLICEKCKGYYKLQSGESILDFKECECGGNLREVDTLDIPYNKQRVKTIIETFKNNYEPSNEKSKHQNGTLKLSISVDYSDGINRLFKDNKSSKKSGNSRVYRTAIKEVAQISELYNFDYIGKIDMETTLEIMEIIADNVYKGKWIIDAANEITSQTSLEYEDALHISQNEINRIKNLGNWYFHKEWIWLF